MRLGPTPPESNAVEPRDPIVPLFACYYTQSSPASHVIQPTHADSVIITPSLPASLPLPSAPDVAAVNGEKVFWEAVKVLQSKKSDDGDEITSLWPPLDVVEGGDDAEDS